MLELFGLVVHLGPAHAHHLDEKQLHEPMAPQHEPRELFARRRVSRTPLYGSYSASPDSASAFTIVVAVPGVTPSAAATWPIGTSRCSRAGSDDWP